MTVVAQSARRVVVNTGSVNEIEVPFPAELAVYVKVYAGDPADAAPEEMQIGVDYTLSGIGPGTAGFVVNLIDGPSWDADIYSRFAVLVDYPVNQPSDISLGGTFGQRFEEALDRVSLNMQSMNDKLKRAVTVPVTQTVDAPNSVSLQPNTLFGTDAEGNVANIDPAAFAALIADTQELFNLLIAVFDLLPNRPDGDITGLAVGQWFISGGYMAKVQP